jgi:hypothetical protein
MRRRKPKSRQKVQNRFVMLRAILKDAVSKVIADYIKMIIVLLIGTIMLLVVPSAVGRAERPKDPPPEVDYAVPAVIRPVYRIEH